MANPLDLQFDTDNSFDKLYMDIRGGRLFAFISTPQGQEQKPMLEVILHESREGSFAKAEANNLIAALMWQKQLHGLKITGRDFLDIHAACAINQEDLMDLANKYLDDHESKLYEDQLFAIGIDRKALHTMSIDISQLPYARETAPSTRKFSRPLIIATTIGAVAAASAAALLSIDLPHIFKSEQKKHSAPVVAAAPETSGASTPPTPKPKTQVAPAPKATPSPEEEAPVKNTKPAPAAIPTPEEAPSETPDCLTLPVITKGNGRGGVIFDEAKSKEVWEKLGFSVTIDSTPEGKKVYLLKDAQGKEFMASRPDQKGQTSIIAKRQ